MTFCLLHTLSLCFIVQHKIHFLITDTSPVAGTFVQHATDSAVTNHMITSMLVDDARACARECLLYRNCASFNYEYILTDGRDLASSGMVCELNDETRNSHHVQFRKRHGYNYYERAQM